MYKASLLPSTAHVHAHECVWESGSYDFEFLERNSEALPEIKRSRFGTEMQLSRANKGCCRVQTMSLKMQTMCTMLGITVSGFRR